MLLPTDLNSTSEAIGVATLVFREKTYTTTFVRYNPAWFIAQYFRTPGDDFPEFDKNLAFCTFLPSTSPGKIDQLYHRGKTPQKPGWAFSISGEIYQVETGFVQGVIEPAYSSITAKAVFNMGNGEVITFEFSAKPR